MTEFPAAGAVRNEPAMEPAHGPIAARVEAVAAARPDATAITHGGSRMSYAALDQRANQIAHLLIVAGVGPGARVALALPRSADMIIAMLAVLKAGACYVPLDPNAPAARQAWILGNCAASALLTTRSVELAAGAAPDAMVLRLDDPATVQRLGTFPGTRPAADRSATPGGLAYVIYTSGSTGQPKGVAIPQSNVLALFDATQSIYGFGPRDVWTLFHSYAFDFSVWEIWGALLHGGRLVIVDDAVRISPPAFLELLERERVTVLNQTPSAFYALLAAEARRPLDASALRYVIFGGEGLDLARLQGWYDRHGDEGPALVNMYGITETTVHVTWIRLDAAMARSARGSLIGEPIPGWSVHLLDAAMEPTPDGEVGEIFVAGPGVAQGYVGRPDLTAERFLPCPFGSPGARMYRSGDLARRLPDGGLEYHGRADQQVKISGYRIELGEIERALETLPAVAQAAAATRDRAGETRLVAYLVPRDGATPPTARDLRTALSARLPDYMTPSDFVWLEALPLTINGKLDRVSLPAPWAPMDRSATTPQTSNADETLESRVSAVFSDYLGGEKLSEDLSFFEHGLKSIDLIKISGRLQECIDQDISVIMLLECGTISKLTSRIGDSRGINNYGVTVADRARQSKSALQRRRDERSRREP